MAIINQGFSKKLLIFFNVTIVTILSVSLLAVWSVKCSNGFEKLSIKSFYNIIFLNDSFEENVCNSPESMC